MKDAVFAAADAQKANRAEGACDAALKALLKAWFAEQEEPVAVLADGLAVPTLARSESALEDYAQNAAWHNGPCFAVCALSGRSAFERGLREYCTALAYIEGKQIKAAMVYDPSHAELYHAVKDLGAYLNGKSIAVSRCKRLMDAYISLDHGTLRTAHRDALHGLFSQVQNIRSGASFSLELCHTAGGRIDAVFGCGQAFIDYAAGLLIAKEAGAAVLGFDGKPLPPINELGERRSLIAVSPDITEELGELVTAL
jgi:3'-phosphoadenosine 5'-phosphosulfate (PAPS) 3'-phosphatase